MSAQKLLIAPLLGMPVSIWLAYFFVLGPRLNALSGCDTFNAAMQYMAGATVAMIVCGLLAVTSWVASRQRVFLLAVVLNLTWLYFVKVVIWGPTFGNL